MKGGNGNRVGGSGRGIGSGGTVPAAFAHNFQMALSAANFTNGTSFMSNMYGAAINETQKYMLQIRDAFGNTITSDYGTSVIPLNDYATAINNFLASGIASTAMGNTLGF